MIRASFGKTAARSTLIGGLVLLAIPAVVGCEAGYHAPTLEFHAASAGAHTDFNGISINNAFVLGAASGSSVPAGSSVGMFVALFNNGTNTDKLVSAEAPGAASSVTIKGGSVAIPATGSANLTGPEPEVVLNGLTKPLAGGQSIDIILDFSNAGAVTLNVPVEPASYYWSSYSPPAVTPSASASATPSSSATPTTSASTSPTPTTSSSATTTASPSPSSTK